ncbi:antitoxin [Vagococcus fluvialis]|uniref:antitoxin n=1 Tax=Vagococcus fluvialis TaxID=2738 RepID=UPI003B2251D9
MEMSYDKTYQIELLNDFSMSIYNRILRYAMKNNIDLENKNHFFSLLFRQLEENLSIKLFDKNIEELEEIRKYWEHMNIYTKEITGIKEVA